MSLYGALFTGVSSLAANSRALGVSSNNIANVNTVGYKASVAQFETLLSRNTPAGDFSTGGVRTIAQQRVDTQGLTQATDSGTDLAISGQGFFVVSERAVPAAGSNGGQLYTRAGSFVPDEMGNLRNAQGYYLMGWQLDGLGNLPAGTSNLTPVNLGDLTGTAEATGDVSIRANLRASTPVATGYTAGAMSLATTATGYVAPDFQSQIDVYDTQGRIQPFTIAYKKTGPNAWSYEVMYNGPATNLSTTNRMVDSGTLEFNSNGQLTAPTTPLEVDIPWSLADSGLQPQTFRISFGQPGQMTAITQAESDSSATISSDGAAFGRVAGVSINDEGIVTAVFDNGVERAVYKLPLAVFSNPNGLTALNANVYRVSEESGNARLLEAKTGGAGEFVASNLEASTVDLAKEFTDMITTQRAYSAATRIISTADAMLQEMLSIKR